MLLVKSLHIIAFTAWFAGLFYLPRLFAYHADCADSAGQARFTVMEKKLYWMIMLPAMLLTLALGIALIAFGAPVRGWLTLKLVLVTFLIIFHISLFAYIGLLQSGRHPSARFFRWYNEVPTVLLIGIVLLAVMKPF